MIRIRYKCGLEGQLQGDPASAPVCPCGKGCEIVRTFAPPPKFRGSCTGPYADTVSIEPGIVNVATAGALRLKEQR